MTGLGHFADLAGTVLAAPAGVGTCRLVGVDGPAGSGKTTFAGRLAVALGARGVRVGQVQVDDLRDGWSDIAGWWPRFRETVLRPLASGRPGGYQRYDWYAGRYADEVITVPVPDVLIIDGVGSASADSATDLTLAVWIAAADPALRLARLVERDGAAMQPHLLRWAAREAEHFAADHTAQRADLRVDGAPTLGYDQESQYIRICLDSRHNADRVDEVARLGDDRTDVRRPRRIWRTQ